MKLALAMLALTATQSLGAQSVTVADSLLRRGSLERAESVYYAAVRVRPRDPVARWSLGRYLAGRGAMRVAVTLFEEAIQFGGEPALIHADLAPLYLALGDYHALAALTTTVSTAERERARWLEAHPTRVVAPDSVIQVGYRPAFDSGSIGTLAIRLNGRIIEAVIAVGVSGIVVSDSLATLLSVRRFPASGERLGLGAADSVGVARLVVTNAPLRIETTARAPVTLGIDVLARFAPTFDPTLGRITLRVSGSLPAGISGDRFSTWSTSTDLRVLQAGGWISLASPQIRRLLAGRVWTLDAKRGQLVLTR